MQTAAYYGGMLAYFWVLATPTIGFLFGCYLYVCVNWFHLHYDEAFSSLRIPHYKGFSRLRITPSGELHIYSLGMDRVCLRSALLPRRSTFICTCHLPVTCTPPLQGLLLPAHHALRRAAHLLPRHGPGVSLPARPAVETKI